LNKVNKDIVILGIESSCDDTSIGISRNGVILSNIVSNQDIHEKYGGVVPELASRQHQKNIIPTITRALKKAKINISEIDGVAFTKGPGLMGSLLVGSSFAKSIALSLNKPLIGINHMEAHVLANFIDNDIKTPCICLTASGGHTELVMVQGIHNMSLIGQTLDDSAGETFDKCAKIIGLKYPGGPEIEKYAKKGKKDTFQFTIPKVKDLNFSFSGLKTNIIQLIDRGVTKNKYFIKENIHDLCASIQHTIIETLIQKLKLAIQKYKIQTIAISGGVAANELFRDRIKELQKTNTVNISIPKKEYSTDNGAMIAIAGYHKYSVGIINDFSINVNPRHKLANYKEEH
jgi:N6-L-threonylcarbamoyladenine synthase